MCKSVTETPDLDLLEPLNTVRNMVVVLVSFHTPRCGKKAWELLDNESKLDERDI